jgi:hypothetical protein
MVQGKTRKLNNKRIDVSPDEWVCVPNTHEPIILPEVFERVQTLLCQASEKEILRKAVPYSPHLFKGKVFCAHCGYPMHRHRQNKDGTYWYRCESQWRYHKDACFQVSVKEKEIQTEVVALLGKYAEAILGRYLRIECAASSRDSAAETELNTVKKRLSASGNFLKNLYENMLGGFIIPEEFASMKVAYENEIKTLSERADEIRAMQRESDYKLKAYQGFGGAAVEVLTIHELTADAMDLLIEKIIVRSDKNFEILLRFRDEFQEVKCVG